MKAIIEERDFIPFEATHGIKMKDKGRWVLVQVLKGTGISIVIFVLVVIALMFAFIGWVYLEIKGLIDKWRMHHGKDRLLILYLL